MEDGKNQAPMSELAAKVKIYKKQIEEAEEIAALNPAKFCKVEVEVEFRSVQVGQDTPVLPCHER